MQLQAMIIPAKHFRIDMGPRSDTEEVAHTQSSC